MKKYIALGLLLSAATLAHATDDAPGAFTQSQRAWADGGASESNGMGRPITWAKA